MNRLRLIALAVLMITIGLASLSQTPGPVEEHHSLAVGYGYPTRPGPESQKRR